MGNMLLLFFMIATAIVLVVGIVFMAIGGRRNREYGNKLMWGRVYLQAIALAILVVLFALKGTGNA
jgi:hypothetical protein